MSAISTAVAIPILMLLMLVPNAFASDNDPRDPFTEKERKSGFYLESGTVKGTGNRPAINPGFDPDYSCLFDILQIQCIPGTEQECPEGFRGNGDGLCVPRTLVDGEWEWLCPKGYHSEFEDESLQCYPNDEGCQNDGYFLLEIEDEYRNDRCAPLYTICDE